MASTGAPQRAFQAEPLPDYRRPGALATELGLAEPVAITLVRRGYRTVEAAREFLDAGEATTRSSSTGMEQAVRAVLLGRRARRAADHVHGDYDVDGVCATAILVSTLRELGADCDWLIPDRLARRLRADEATVERARRPGHRAADHRRLRDRLGRGGRSRPRGGDRGGRHRPPRPATRSPTARSCTRSSRRVSVSRTCARRGSPTSSPAALLHAARPVAPRAGGPGAAIAGPRPGRARHRRRHGPAAGREPRPGPRRAWRRCGAPRARACAR